MPAPIPFSVAPAVRSGTFRHPAGSGTIPYPGGYSQLQWQLDGLGSGTGSDYENPANAARLRMFYSTDGGANFGVFDDWSWRGGPYAGKGGTVDPPPQGTTPLGNLPAGALLFFQIDLTGTFTVGMSGSIT